jgi:hypothetical protein
MSFLLRMLYRFLQKEIEVNERIQRWGYHTMNIGRPFKDGCGIVAELSWCAGLWRYWSLAAIRCELQKSISGLSEDAKLLCITWRQLVSVCSCQTYEVLAQFSLPAVSCCCCCCFFFFFNFRSLYFLILSDIGCVLCFHSKGTPMFINLSFFPVLFIIKMLDFCWVSYYSDIIINSPTHSFTDSSTPPTYLLAHPPTDSMTHSLTHSPTDSLAHILIHRLTHPLTHHRLARSLTHLPTHRLAHIPTHRLTHSLTHSPTHPPTDSLVHLPTLCVIYIALCSLGVAEPAKSLSS